MNIELLERELQLVLAAPAVSIAGAFIVFMAGFAVGRWAYSRSIASCKAELQVAMERLRLAQDQHAIVMKDLSNLQQKIQGDPHKADISNNMQAIASAAERLAQTLASQEQEFILIHAMRA